MTKIKSAVIGLGNMGAGFDYGQEKLELTHAKSFSKNSEFELVGACDPSEAARKKFSEAYPGVTAFASVDELMKSKQPAVVSIATPVQTHLKVFEQVSNYPVKLVLLEKPLAQNVEEAKKLEQLSKQKKIPVLVNYMRRFQPEIQKLKTEIQNGEFGKPVKGVAWYTKGALNNASHLIDLFDYVLGEVKPESATCLGAKESHELPFPDDQDIDFKATFGSTPIYFLVSDHRAYEKVEFELVFEKASIRFLNAGYTIEKRHLVTDPVFTGYTLLDEFGKTTSTDFLHYQKYVTDAALKFLKSGEPLVSTPTSALRSMEFVCRLFQGR